MKAKDKKKDAEETLRRLREEQRKVGVNPFTLQPANRDKPEGSP